MTAMRAEQRRLPAVTARTVRGIGAMASVDEYLQYAEQCVALAGNSSSPADKARLLQMAQAWRELADKLGGGDSQEPGERGSRRREE